MISRGIGVVAGVLCWASVMASSAADTESPPERSARPALVAVAAATAHAPAAPETATELRRLADEYLAWRTEREPLVRLARDLPVEDLAHYDFESAAETSRFARDMLPQVRAIDRLELPERLRPLRQILELELTVDAGVSRYYWLGFLVTPYSGGDIHVEVQRVLHAQRIDTPAAADRYLHLLRAYVRVLDEIHDKTVEQQRRGILVPRAAIPGCIELIDGLQNSLSDSISLTPERLSLLAPNAAARLRREVDRMIEREIAPRLERVRAVFDDDYSAAAPESVGLSQYPGGSGYYRALVQRYTGYDYDPRQIHDDGLRWVSEINAHLGAIREQLGYAGTRGQFHEMLRTDPRWLAESPDDIAENYTAFLQKIEPLLPRYFSKLPEAPYGVKRLDERDEPGMTYGFYQSPTPADPRGYYRFNGSGLQSRTQISAQHLIYHELMPGHHLQVGLQLEMSDVHPLQTLSSYGAYDEGWGEYAASLGVEMGLYEAHDLYGHYLMQLIVAVRLVADTGMNALGWTLDEGRRYMADQLLLSPRQIESESLRYSTDIPGQALSYGIGYQRFWELRRRTERALGSQFSIRDFHEAVLEHGAVPLPVLDGQVDALTLRATKGQAARHISAVNVASIVIPASPAEVWDLLLERSNWMDGVVSAESTRGEPGQTGSRMLYLMHREDGGSPAPRAEETLLAIAGERLVLRAYSPEVDTTSAIADFRLSPAKSGTHVEMSAYWSEDADELMALDELEKLEQSYLDSTQEIIEGYLRRLRQSAPSDR